MVKLTIRRDIYKQQIGNDAAAFQNRRLDGEKYPSYGSTLHEKVRFDGRVVSMAILLVCDVNSHGRREALAVEPMLAESRES